MGSLPFTAEQFFNVFQRYNEAIWPAQIVACALGVLAVYLALRGSGPIVSAILGVFWLWMGVVYHILYFSAINRPAYFFGAVFVIQGLLFLTVLWPRLNFRAGLNALSAVGGLFILYALVIYPLFGMLFGHFYPGAAMFGVAPCPTTIFTFGLLLWTDRRVPKYALAIPLVWSLIAVGAALSLSVPQDYALPVAGVVGTILLIVRDARMAPALRSASPA